MHYPANFPIINMVITSKSYNIMTISDDHQSAHSKCDSIGECTVGLSNTSTMQCIRCIVESLLYINAMIVALRFFSIQNTYDE